MTQKVKINYDEISALAETILCDVDYDIYKEDLEEREIISVIEFRLRDLVEGLMLVDEGVEDE